jgi:hypothetical protein
MENNLMSYFLLFVFYFLLIWILASVRSSTSLRRNPFIGCATIELWFTTGNNVNSKKIFNRKGAKTRGNHCALASLRLSQSL